MLLRDVKMDDKTNYIFQIKIIRINEYYKILKRHSDFEGLYEALSLTFAQLDFPKPPSKFRLINKVKHRKDFYMELLSSIKIHMMKQPSYRELFMKKLYHFFIVEAKLIDQKDAKQDNEAIADDSITREKESYCESTEYGEESGGGRTTSLFEEASNTRAAVYNSTASEGYKVRMISYSENFIK